MKFFYYVFNLFFSPFDLYFHSILIPESDVSLFWDSTLNSTYDDKCTVNQATPMTPSERACAASHLKVWRNISEMRETLFSAPTPSSTSSSSSSSSSSVSKNVPSISSDILEEEEANKNDNVNPKLIEISRGCFRLSRVGGGWIPLPSTTGRSNLQNKKDSTIQRKPVPTTDNENNFDDWYLILEDDAETTNNVIADGLQVAINKILHQKLPNDFDICYLGHVLPNNCQKTFFRGGEIIKPNYAWCLHSYIVRGKAINTLLSNLPINCPVDNFIGQLLYDEIIQVVCNTFI